MGRASGREKEAEQKVLESHPHLLKLCAIFSVFSCLPVHFPCLHSAFANTHTHTMLLVGSRRRMFFLLSNWLIVVALQNQIDFSNSVNFFSY